MSNVRFSRVSLGIGEEGLSKLQRSRVAIIGLGAVGGFAAEALVRSGIGSLKIIDIDHVQISNFNRQIIALETTLGLPKVEAAKRRLLDINPGLILEAKQEFFHKDSADSLLEGPFDYVIDAIDAALPKIELLSHCHQRGLPVISSMGAAFKKRFDLVKIVDISETSTCPLAKLVRRRLRRRGIKTGVTVIFSDEPGPPFKEPEEIENPEEATGTHRGRPRRILGSLCPMAGIFGLLAAHYVIFQLIRPKDA